MPFSKTKLMEAALSKNDLGNCSGHVVKVGWLVDFFYGVSTLFGSFNAELSLFKKGFKQFSLA